MFGVEEKKVALPYVETQNAQHGVVSAYPKFKYHKELPEGVVVNSQEEEDALPGEGWVNSPAEFGVETAPSADKVDPVKTKLAAMKEAAEAPKKKGKKGDDEAKE